MTRTALMLLVCLLLGVSVSAHALTVAISDMPASRVFTAEVSDFKLVLLFDVPTASEDAAVHYEMITYDSGELIVQDEAPFHTTTMYSGWAPITPPDRPQTDPRWYVLKATLQTDSQSVTLPEVTFGMMPADDVVAFDGLQRSGEGGETDTSDGHRDDRRKVMVFYYTWYGNPDFQNHWVHWPEGGHDPNTFDATGLPDLGARHHPMLGAYDSFDPYVIDTHIRWAESAGIDVFISTWWGIGDQSDRVLPHLLDAVTDSSLGVALYYETVPGGTPEGIINDLRYIDAQYGDHPGMFRHEGKAVVFIYSRAIHQLTFDEWRQVIEVAKAETDLLLIADTVDTQWAEIFDGLHNYNPVGAVATGNDMQRMFDLQVKAASDHGKISSVTIIPGYDDSNIGRANVIVADREEGALYDRLWDAAIQSDPDWILITSFNEWHEGSEIEPSVEHGMYYLRRTQNWVDAFHQAPSRSFSFEDQSFPAVVLPGGIYDVRVGLRSSLEPGRPDGDDTSLIDALATSWQLPTGWELYDEMVQVSTDGVHVILTGQLSVPDTVTVGEHDIAVTVGLLGYERRLDVAIVVPEVDRVAERNRADGPFVWVELGDPDAEFGLAHRFNGDGASDVVTLAGVQARQLKPADSDHMYLYFDISDQFLYDIADVTVDVIVEYLDEGTASFQVQYDSHNRSAPVNGAYANSSPVRLTDSGEWKRGVVRLTDARFANRQNAGADFRIAAGMNRLVVRSVQVAVAQDD